MNDLDDRPLDQSSYAFQDIIGQRPLGFPLGFITFFPVVGVPSNALGKNGDYAFRQDAGAGTHLYFKAAGAWAAVI